MHEAVCDGDVVACRSTMTGTHQGPLNIGPMAGLAITGAHIEVAHMHFLRYDDDGRMTDLWHVWDTLSLARAELQRPTCASAQPGEQTQR